MTWLRASLLFGLGLAVPALAAAQGSPAFTLRGVVLDAMRAPILGAQIQALPEGLPAATPAASAVTDATGAFAVQLPPGRFVVTATAAGFLASTRPVAATATGSASAEFVLQVAGVKEDVTVSAAAGYQVPVIRTATKTATPLIDVPQSITVVSHELIKDQMMMSVGDALRYVPGAMVHQGENNRDEVIIRGNGSSANFFIDGVRDDVQYHRDLYNVERVEALKGSNAMIFGRGVGGGVVNRVSKEASAAPSREFSLQGGMYGNSRFTGGVDQPIGDTAAIRLDGLFEHSDSFRDYVNLQRYGVTPTFAWTASDRTKVSLRYEYLNDQRVADRGVTSYQGRPADVPIATYYGNPNLSDVKANVNLAAGTIEHRWDALTIRNHTLLGNYDRSYQNFVPGAVNANKTLVTLTAYNNATNRTNFFNQTDATAVASTGRIRHTLLAGSEYGHQLTDNFRNTGFFNDTTTSVQAPYDNPTISTPVTFRQSATDADNHLTANVAAVYAQDQIELTRYLQAVAGLRFDHFDLNYHNNRTGDTLARPDNLLSPRLGVIVKPLQLVSIYSSYSVSYLPGSGDQFSSLTSVTELLKPEQFRSYEVGAKWDPYPTLSLTTAVYRLDRTNTRSADPNNPTVIVQTGSQRTNGYEAGANGRVTSQWSIAGGYAYQNAFVTNPTATAGLGAQVGQVPHHTLSLWNNYQLRPKVAAAVGVIYRGDMFATIDNTVTLPGYTRVDLAGYYNITRQLRLQANVENMFNTTYYINADSNTNISPGFPRALRVGLTATF